MKRRVEQVKPLKPGESRILKALQNGPKSNKELRETTGMNKNFLGDYLMALQKSGLIKRNFENKKYELAGNSIQTLLFEDITSLIDKQLSKKIHSENKEETGIAEHYPWLVITESSAFGSWLAESFNEPEKHELLCEAADMLDEQWSQFTLFQRVQYKPWSGTKEGRAPEETQATIQVILQYRQYLLEVYNACVGESEEAIKAELMKDEIPLAKEYLKKEFPENGEPSDQSVYYEAARRVKKELLYRNKLCQPWDYQDLTSRLETAEVHSQLSNPDLDKVRDLIAFLEDPQNKQTYEDYCNSLKNAPKTLLLNPAFGFRTEGYLEKLQNNFPEKIAQLRNQDMTLEQFLKLLRTL